MDDKRGDMRAIEATNAVQRIAIETLAPLALRFRDPSWRPEFQAIVLRAVAHRALKMAADAQNAGNNA